MGGGGGGSNVGGESLVVSASFSKCSHNKKNLLEVVLFIVVSNSIWECTSSSKENMSEDNCDLLTFVLTLLLNQLVKILCAFTCGCIVVSTSFQNLT